MKLQPRIAFIHVPKTGGTSLDSAIQRACFPMKRFFRNRTFNLRAHPSAEAAMILGMPTAAIRLCMLTYWLNISKCEYVAGHFPVNAEVLSLPWSFVTVLRDPLERWLSEFFYNRYKEHRQHAAISSDLGDFVDSDRARQMGTMYLRAFTASNATVPSESTLPQMIDHAKENLMRFALIGFTDELLRFSEEFHTVFGKRLRIPHMNTNPLGSAAQADRVTPDIRNRIAELVQPDMEIFRFARNEITSGN